MSSPTLNKTALRRLLEIDQLVRSGAYPTAEELARRFEVTERTIFRDLAFLRDQLMAPLGCRREQEHGGGYYYTDTAYILPANFVRRAEAAGLLLAGKLAAETAGQPRGAALAGLLYRLRGLMDRGELELIENEVAAFDYVARQLHRTDPALVEAVGGALLERRRVSGELFAPDLDGGPHWERVVIEPWRLVHLNGAWYLLGCDTAADRPRVVPLAALRRHAVLDERYLIPEDFDFQTALSDIFGFRLGGEEYRVELEFHGSAARLVAEREWHPSQHLSFQADGSLVLSLRSANLDELSRWLVGFGGEVRVRAPRELILLCHERLEAFMANQR